MAYTLQPNVTLPYGQGTQFVPNNSDGVVNYQSGAIVMDANAPVAVQIPVGFNPRKVRFVDITSYVEYEQLDQMPAANTIKTVAAGTKTIDTTGVISVGSDAAGTARTVTIAASALTASHTYVYEAFA